MRRGESIYNQMTEMGADWKGQSRNCRSSAVVLAQTSSGLLKCIFPSTAGIYYNCQSNRVSAVPRGNRARFPVVCRRRQRRTADMRLHNLPLHVASTSRSDATHEQKAKKKELHQELVQTSVSHTLTPLQKSVMVKEHHIDQSHGNVHESSIGRRSLQTECGQTTTSWHTLVAGSMGSPERTRREIRWRA
jgi:hypothetical protein